MPHKSDDPRQVLAVLNSLGFVGITAEQLKAFMKGNGFPTYLLNDKFKNNNYTLCCFFFLIINILNF